MQDAVRRHDTLMRAAIDANGGYVFKTIADAFCAAFWRPEDAMAAALAAQRALVAEDFSAVDGVRMRTALHMGTADERDGDYFGPAVNRVARLLAIGHGGQVLVSGTAADLLQGEMPPQSSLRDLGAHRLKDLARPEQVYQLVAPDLPESFGALRSLDAMPGQRHRVLRRAGVALPRALSTFAFSLPACCTKSICTAWNMYPLPVPGCGRMSRWASLQFFGLGSSVYWFKSNALRFCPRRYLTLKREPPNAANIPANAARRRW